MEVHLQLEGAQGRSLRAKCEHALREAVRDGRLASGTRLPSTRALAAELGVSRGVVVEAYAQLAAEGYLLTRRGGGTTVAAVRPTSAPAPGPLEAGSTAPRYDMRPALPALDGFPRRAWLARLARVIREVPDERLAERDAAGEPELRRTVAAWLARRRGLRAQPQQVLISAGVGASLPLVWGAAKRRGARRVAVEEPGWPQLQASVAAAGLEAIPVPIDAEGLDVSVLDDRGADVVAVTPAHQYPTGAVLSARRRAQLVAWARRRNGLLVEDDYDAEYRYDRQPIGSLQGLAPDVVVYAGSTSKMLAPVLRLGWLIPPPSMLRDLGDADDRATAPVLDQLALASFIERGDLDRHLRRQRQRYARRRSALLSALRAAMPGIEVSGAAAGLHIVLRLPVGCDEDQIVAAARAKGMALAGVRADWPGLLLGYANLPETSAVAAVELLEGVLAEHRPAERAHSHLSLRTAMG